MEDESIGIVAGAIPRHWVPRQYRPDYGLDLAVETFESVPRSNAFEALGEHFFAQVKSVGAVRPIDLKVGPRFNVAKVPRSIRHPDEEKEVATIRVIPFRIDTPLLATVQAMGASAVVALFVVCLERRSVYFVCLNDYIDKVLLPEHPDFADQETVTVHVPVANEIGRSKEHAAAVAMLAFFAKRAKFYSAFNLFDYQRHELEYAEHPRDRRRFATHFLQQLKRLDMWHGHAWSAVRHYLAWLRHLEKVLPEVPDIDWFRQHPTVTSWIPDGAGFDDEERAIRFDLQLQTFWRGLTSISRSYEEICREWYLPTYMSEMTR